MNQNLSLSPPPLKGRGHERGFCPRGRAAKKKRRRRLIGCKNRLSFPSRGGPLFIHHIKLLCEGWLKIALAKRVPFLGARGLAPAPTSEARRPKRRGFGETNDALSRVQKVTFVSVVLQRLRLCPTLFPKQQGRPR